MIALVASSAATPIAVASPAPAAAAHRDPSTIARTAWPSASTIAAAADASGTIVRREPGLTVERIDGSALGDASPTAQMLWRVRVSGRFPPRALRYTVLVDGAAIGYGTPTPREDAVVAVTSDAAVLSGDVTTTYGSGREATASRPTPESHAPHGGTIPDPAAPGPLAVGRTTYNLGDQVYTPPGLHAAVELSAVVHYPRGLPSGPYPIVLFLHGNHSSCYRGTHAAYAWPCPAGWRPIPNDAGYDYLARSLASWGFIVVSVSGNGVNVLGNRVDDTGMRQRGELLEKHLDLWRRWSTVGGRPFGSRFVGEVDLTRTGTMGHSRGGEGAVWQVIEDRQRAHPYGIDAVLPLAPVDFTRVTVNNIPLAVMLPYCDGDVSDLEGVHFFDDARYRVPGDPTPKDAITVMGANHNFFNTVWSPSGGYPGAFDDGTGCAGRLTESEQRAIGAAYVVGFFRRWLGPDPALDSMWTGEATPEGIPARSTRVSYLPPDTPTGRLDVDRFTEPNSLAVDSLGGRVVERHLAVSKWCAETFRHPCVPGRLEYTDVHLPGLSQGVLAWDDRGARVRFSIPPGDRDVKPFGAVQFRTAVNPAYPENRGTVTQDLELKLLDSNGHSASVAASDVGADALRTPVGLRNYTGHIILNDVRFPLARYHGVNMHRIRAVVLRFSRTDAGAIDVADLSFTP
jgi:hypothetical protein